MNAQIQSEKIWYSFNKGAYKGIIPSYCESDQFPWIAEMETDFELIRKETNRLIDEQSDLFVPYFNPDLVKKQGSWKTLVFYFWSLRNNELMEQSPILEAYFDKIPGFISAAISKLESGAEIGWHTGDTSGVVRCHFPISVPDILPVCGFEVGEEKRSWNEGEMLLFCDAHRHRAFNHSKQDRIMIIIDIVHPQYANKKKKIIANSLSIMWLQRILLKIKFLQKLPGFIRGAIRHICLVFIYLYLPFKQRKKRTN